MLNYVVRFAHLVALFIHVVFPWCTHSLSLCFERNYTGGFLEREMGGPVYVRRTEVAEYDEYGRKTSSSATVNAQGKGTNGQPAGYNPGGEARSAIDGEREASARSEHCG